jgi:hypothetical protein
VHSGTHEGKQSACHRNPVRCDHRFVLRSEKTRLNHTKPNSSCIYVHRQQNAKKDNRYRIKPTTVSAKSAYNPKGVICPQGRRAPRYKSDLLETKLEELAEGFNGI